MGIAELNHPASELIMLRKIIDVANINYWLRCQGDTLDEVKAANFDNELRAAAETTLGSAIPDHRWWQAELAVQKGGLGMHWAQRP